MELKWGLYTQCMNEKELIEAKLEWALERDFVVSIAEGHHQHYDRFHPKTHLSIDGTSEILESYSDRIIYTPIGGYKLQKPLRNIAYKALPEDLDVVIMCDVDEFYTDDDLEYLDNIYRRNKNIKLTVTDSLIFLDDEYCAPHIRRKQGQPFIFNLKNPEFYMGMFHERIFRYNKYYSYRRGPYLINDIYGRYIFEDPIYIDDRMLIEDVKMLHYKNFKLQEAKERTKMYKEYDFIDHSDEWDILEKNKFKYEGEHPKQIKELLTS